MNMTKKEFFKRRNKNKLYSIYEDDILRAYRVSDNYCNNLIYLQELKAEYRNNSYIWEILTSLEKRVTGSFYNESVIRCQHVKYYAYKVDSLEYEFITNDIEKLATANGKMDALFDIVSYLKDNNLGVRSS